MVAVVARVALQYEGRSVSAGETFGAAPIDALVLRHQGKVTWNGPPRHYHPPPEPPPAPDPPPVEVEAEALKPRRRTYRRRDLEPETLETPESPAED